MRNDNDDSEVPPFSISKEKAFEVIIDLLIEISANQKTLQELFLKDVKTKEDLDETLSDLTKSNEFYKNQVCKYLLSRYSDLGDILPSNVHQPND